MGDVWIDIIDTVTLEERSERSPFMIWKHYVIRMLIASQSRSLVTLMTIHIYIQVRIALMTAINWIGFPILAWLLNQDMEKIFLGPGVSVFEHQVSSKNLKNFQWPISEDFSALEMVDVVRMNFIKKIQP